MKQKAKFKKIGANFKEAEAIIIEARAKSIAGNTSKYIKGLVAQDLENKLNEHEPVLTQEKIIKFIKSLSLIELLGMRYFNL